MIKPIEHSGLQIAPVIYTLVSDEICPAVGIDADQFWRGFADIVYRFAPRNIALLDRREKLQEQIDHWHQSNAFDYDAYKDLQLAAGSDPLLDYGDWKNFRSSAGLSVQWISPMGPMVFSFSKALKQRPGDDAKFFTFNIGQTF